MKYLILGGGSAGLSMANALRQRGIDDFLLLEKEDTVGGLCRSIDVDGTPLDIGGGHFLDTRRLNVNDFLFQFMPEEEWNVFERDSRIDINGTVINHPIESNIWQMNLQNQVEYLKSIANAGCNRGLEMPNDFVDWIHWKLGDKISEEYMIPYNQKIFGKRLNELGTYWLEKLPSVNFEETLYSCLDRKAYGMQPGHARFYYPKHFGYGELWLRMADAIQGKIEYKKEVKEIDFNTKTITTSDGSTYRAEHIITTIPWSEYASINGMPREIEEGIKDLKYSSIQIKYFAENIDTPCHWIYCPDQKLPYHRILVRHNFCSNSKGYWTETNTERLYMESDDSNFKYLNKYAYPLNTKNKPQIMKKLLTWCNEHNVYGLGRWGEHEHLNSDVVVDLALKLAERIS